MVNYGCLTILGEGFFDGDLITRAYHLKDGDVTVDFASGTTTVREQEQDNLLDGDDKLPLLIIEGGTFINDEGEELVKRYVSWNESGNEEYSESDSVGKILLTGGLFAHYPAYAAQNYHAVDHNGMYGIEENYGEDLSENGSKADPDTADLTVAPEKKELEQQVQLRVRKE